jgi:hypothetical protein
MMPHFRRVSSDQQTAYYAVQQALEAWLTTKEEALLEFTHVCEQDAQGQHIVWAASCE